jgi:glutamate synthase (NADPH) small chain
MAGVFHFLDNKRSKVHYRPVGQRLGDWKEVEEKRTDDESIDQANRCMNCGTPFCLANCPLGNFIPEWNALAKEGRWREAWERLSLTAPFPEITGRLCPALCEGGCVLAYNDDAVTIRQNELDIIERATKNGWVQPRPPAARSGKKVAIIGSGPASLAAAAALNKLGHSVTVFERDSKPGGFLRYGIPDFKLDKEVLDRRLAVMKAEGIEFQCGVEIGKKLDAASLKSKYDAIVLASGTRSCRDLKVPGRDLPGVMFAVDYLRHGNRMVSGEDSFDAAMDAKGKNVVVIGGGDTGSDCVGTANRQGAAKVVQIEILPKLPEKRPAGQPWPQFPRLFKTTSSHEEGVSQDYEVNTKAFAAKDGKLSALECVRVEWDMSSGKPAMKELAGSEFRIEAEMAILALGFLGAEKSPMLEQLGIALSPQGLVGADAEYMTGVPGVFAAGDMRRGQSLIVWGFQEGQRAAESVDRWLAKRV